MMTKIAWLKYSKQTMEVDKHFEFLSKLLFFTIFYLIKKFVL